MVVQLVHNVSKITLAPQIIAQDLMDGGLRLNVRLKPKQTLQSVSMRCGLATTLATAYALLRSRKN